MGGHKWVHGSGRDRSAQLLGPHPVPQYGRTLPLWAWMHATARRSRLVSTALPPAAARHSVVALAGRHASVEGAMAG